MAVNVVMAVRIILFIRFVCMAPRFNSWILNYAHFMAVHPKSEAEPFTDFPF